MNSHKAINLKKALAFFYILALNVPLLLLAQDSLSMQKDTIYAPLDSINTPLDSINEQSALPCPERDIADVLRDLLNMPPKEKKEGAGSLMLLPIIGSNPATGFMVGIGGQYAFEISEDSKYSLISGSIQYTTLNQFIFMLKNNIYTNDNRIFFTGDWRYLIFSQSTYGLGTTSPDGGILDYQFGLAGSETNADSLTQPMTFNFGRLHQSVMFELASGFYLGLTYRYDTYFDILDKKLRLEPGDSLLTSHYAYNTYYGFNTQQYHSSSIGASFIIDKRDNMIQPYSGYFLSVNWQGGYEFIGNDRTSNLFQIEWRSYHGLSKSKPAHLIAFWFMGDFTQKGTVPYMILPATAYDQRGRASRGYTQGRFRGPQMIYGEVEYRFPISRCNGLLGGVVFANATTASNPGLSLNLFESIRPSYGFGLRVKIEKQSRTNLAIDLGFGQKSVGFYLAVSEAF